MRGRAVHVWVLLLHTTSATTYVVCISLLLVSREEGEGEGNMEEYATECLKTMYWQVFDKTQWEASLMELADGAFTTAREQVPLTLDACPLSTIQKYFHLVFQYMDAYR